MRKLLGVLVLAAMAVGVSWGAVEEDRALCARYIARDVMAGEIAGAAAKAIAGNRNEKVTDEAIKAHTEASLYARWASVLRSALRWAEQTAGLSEEQADALLRGEDLDVTRLSAKTRALLWFEVSVDPEGWTASQWVRGALGLRRSELTDKLLAVAGSREQVCIDQYVYLGFNTRHLREMLEDMQSDVRHKLREEGKGIVTVDGVNPVEVAMQPLFEACNAPMLKGLEGAIAAVTGDKVKVDRSMKAELEAVKKNVWYGDAPAAGATLAGIHFLLGTEGYNAWAAAYNAK